MNIHSAKAVRVSPTGIQPENGQICTYYLTFRGEDLGKIKHPYGDAVGLAVKMLEATNNKEQTNV
jgi:hypothetical protein